MLDKNKCMILIKNSRFSDVYELISNEYDKMFTNLLIMKQVDEDLNDCTLSEKCQLMLQEFPDQKYMILDICHSFYNEDVKLDERIINLMNNYKGFEDYYLKTLK